MVVFALKMVSKTLVVKADGKQLSNIFYLREFFSSAKNLCLLVVLLSAISIITECKPCGVNEVPNQFKFDRGKPYRGKFVSPDVVDGLVGPGFLPRIRVRQHGLENTCQPSSSFCFPSILSGFEDDEIDTGLEELDASEVQPGGFSFGLKPKSNLGQLPNHGYIRFLVGLSEFSSGQAGTRNGLRTEVSSFVNSLLDQKTHTSMQVGKNESLFSVDDGFTTPPVDTTPYLIYVTVTNYAHVETRQVDSRCKITVLVNDTSLSRMKIPCADVIGVLLDSSVGNVEGIGVDCVNGGGRFFSNNMLPSSRVEVVYTRGTHESSLSVIIGNYSYRRITVKNPSKKPVAMQPFLKSGEVVDNCRIPEMLLQPSSFDTLVGRTFFALRRYGFSIIAVLIFVGFFVYMSRSSDARFSWKSDAKSSFEISTPSTEDKLEPCDQRVRVEKEKERRQRKKKSSGFGRLLSEFSSSRNDNATPPSLSSPTGTHTPPKETCRNPVLESGDPFSRGAPLERSNTNKCPQTPSKANKPMDEAQPLKSKGDNYNYSRGPSTHVKPVSTMKVGIKAAPHASFPSGVGGSHMPCVRRSSLSACARAPGSKMLSQCEKKMVGVEPNYTYDIWGDHLFGLQLGYQSTKASGLSMETESESFFVRGPQALVKNNTMLLQSCDS